MKQLIMAIAVLLCTFSCKTQKSTTTAQNQQVKERTQQRPNRGDRKGPRSVDEVFQMDTNNDGLLSMTEVKGRMKERFTKIDTNGDGFISKTEFQNMQKPQRGQRQRPQKQ